MKLYCFRVPSHIPDQKKIYRQRKCYLSTQRIPGLMAMSHHPCMPTLTMCSLGSRLQSANVISLPSRNLRVENLMSSILFSSISSGRGEFRYSSSFCRVFKRPLSNAERKMGLLWEGKPPKSLSNSVTLSVSNYFIKCLVWHEARWTGQTRFLLSWGLFTWGEGWDTQVPLFR